jgi:hypothetical protein
MSFPRRWLGVPCGDLDPVAELDGQMPAMSQIAPIIADLVAETTRDHELGTAVHTMLRTPRHLQIQELFTRAAARGNSIRKPRPN